MKNISIILIIPAAMLVLYWAAGLLCGGELVFGRFRLRLWTPKDSDEF